MPEDSGDRVIRRQCKKKGWEEYQERWLTAASVYRDSRGDPWLIVAADFTDTEKAQLSSLYDTRRHNGVIARIRRPEGGFPSCPMCGSSGGRSLDHALPRASFPEFSIVRENLVPACTICNSDEKGADYRGSTASQRLIHPYYDEWAAQPIWQVAFGSDLEAATLHSVPCGDFDASRKATIEFHLSGVLGQEWRESSRRYWGQLPYLIRRRLGNELTTESTRRELILRLDEETYVLGVNAWKPAFLRGALADDRVPAYIAARARILPTPPGAQP